MQAKYLCCIYALFYSTEKCSQTGRFSLKIVPKPDTHARQKAKENHLLYRRFLYSFAIYIYGNITDVIATQKCNDYITLKDSM